MTPLAWLAGFACVGAAIIVAWFFIAGWRACERESADVSLADQEIRTRALELAIEACLDGCPVPFLVETARHFETFLRGDPS